MTNQQGAPEAPRGTAADGKTELFNVPGYPLMVRAVDFNRLHAENERLAALGEAQQPATCGNTPYDEGPFTLAQGFRDGVASVAASAGSEPVAPSGWREAIGEIRAGLEDSEPSGYDNSGYRAFAGTVLDAVEEALTELITHPSPPEGMVGGWMPIETAPKSSTDGRNVDVIYLLGFCPEPDACNLQSYICIMWWGPNMKGGKGMWYGEGGYEVHPTHWMPLPPPSTSAEGVEHG